MNVTFSKEYRDPETGKTHKAGDQADVPDAKAQKLVQDGVAKQSGGEQQSSQQQHRGS